MKGDRKAKDKEILKRKSTCEDKKDENGKVIDKIMRTRRQKGENGDKNTCERQKVKDGNSARESRTVEIGLRALWAERTRQGRDRVMQGEGYE